MDFLFAQLGGFADRVGTHVVNVLLTFASLGALSMGAVQLLKDLSPLRRRFNRACFDEWTATSGCHGAANARAMLVRLAAAGDDEAFFDLDVDRLAGQLSAAASVVVEYPALYEPAFRILARSADPQDISTVLAPPAGKADPAVVAARTRVSHQVQRAIDAFQISTAFQWKRRLQLIAFGISYVLATIGLLYGRSGWSDLFNAIPVALAAGVIAPVARDLVAVLTSARAR